MGMNNFELNGKLLEVSLMLNCDVYDLIEVKNEIVKKGRMNADDKHRLMELGFPIGKEDFFTALNKFIASEPDVTDGYVNSFGWKYKAQLEEIHRRATQ